MHHPADEDLESALVRAARLVRGAEWLAVLTGAGVSAESGVATFRGAGGRVDDGTCAHHQEAVTAMGRGGRPLPDVFG